VECGVVQSPAQEVSTSQEAAKIPNRSITPSDSGCDEVNVQLVVHPQPYSIFSGSFHRPMYLTSARNVNVNQLTAELGSVEVAVRRLPEEERMRIMITNAKKERQKIHNKQLLQYTTTK
jgi:hypothetical protein